MSVSVTDAPVPDVVVPVVAVVGAIAIAFVIAALIGTGVRALARKWPQASELSRRGRRPLRLLLTAVGVIVALALTTTDSSWTPIAYHGLVIVMLIAIGWLLVQMTFVVEGAIIERFPVDVPDNRHARRVRTQVQVMRRLAAAVIVIVVGAVILFTFPGMRAVGASILASAGVVSIIAGLAAQTSLANVFAGMQIAFTDALRVDDVVVVEDEWGRIEEITMTYVVVQIWDDRRLVLPSTYFTSTPFQNWTRKASQLLGTVELDVDWTVPIEGLRREMERLLRETDLWDHRVGIIQVTDAIGGAVRVRALASAESGPILWDLRCYLREGLVRWLQESGSGLPRTRLETIPRTPSSTPAILPGPERSESAPAPTGTGPLAATDAGRARLAPMSDTGLFTGTAEATERSRSFTGPLHDSGTGDPVTGDAGTGDAGEVGSGDGRGGSGRDATAVALPAADGGAAPTATPEGSPSGDATHVLPRVERRSTRRRETGEGGGGHGDA